MGVTRGGDGVDMRRAVRIGPAVALAGAVILVSAGPGSTDTPVDRELARARAAYESASEQAQSALIAYNEYQELQA